MPTLSLCEATKSLKFTVKSPADGGIPAMLAQLGVKTPVMPSVLIGQVVRPAYITQRQGNLALVILSSLSGMWPPIALRAWPASESPLSRAAGQPSPAAQAGVDSDWEQDSLRSWKRPEHTAQSQPPGASEVGRLPANAAL